VRRYVRAVVRPSKRTSCGVNGSVARVKAYARGGCDVRRKRARARREPGFRRIRARHRTHETNRHATVATIGRGVRAVRAPIGVTPRGHRRRVGRAQRDSRRAARA
jgi:hypothetical protein